MNLESKWLEDFSALAATRSFSQAAKRRFVTQPAFSRRIRSLEAALGLTLVNRARTPRCCAICITWRAARAR
jgi:DNA-binding transcriptional LysR family regulator